jgi:ABC-2 type transport system ATP-binding protein
MMKINNMTLQHDGHDVLFDNISYEFFQKNAYAICGPNGSGKSSLLRILSGVDNPNNGDVFVNQFRMRKSPVCAKKRIGYCPDKANMYGFIKAGEFIKWIQGIYGIYNETYTNELINSFRVESYLNQTFSKLSLGTAKKFFIIASLLHQPNIIIMDEPTSAIDRESKDYLIHLLQGYKNNSLIIVATHDSALIDSLGCQVIQLSLNTNKSL